MPLRRSIRAASIIDRSGLSVPSLEVKSMTVRYFWTITVAALLSALGMTPLLFVKKDDAFKTSASA
jgi:hypothetical protein